METKFKFSEVDMNITSGTTPSPSQVTKELWTLKFIFHKMIWGSWRRGEGGQQHPPGNDHNSNNLRVVEGWTYILFLAPTAFSLEQVYWKENQKKDPELYVMLSPATACGVMFIRFTQIRHLDIRPGLWKGLQHPTNIQSGTWPLLYSILTALPLKGAV